MGKGELPVENEIIEEKKDPIEELEQQINDAPDAEQFRCYDLTRPGQPLKYIAVRSQSMNKQVVSVPQYYELKDGEETIGFQRWSDEKIVQDYGVEESVDVQVLGTRKRGE